MVEIIPWINPYNDFSLDSLLQSNLEVPAIYIYFLFCHGQQNGGKSEKYLQRTDHRREEQKIEEMIASCNIYIYMGRKMELQDYLWRKVPMTDKVFHYHQQNNIQSS